MAYKYKPVRRQAAPVTGVARIQPQPAPEDAIGLIDGRVPDSKEEWWVYLALKRLRLPYFYQFKIGGGKDIRGGVVVDFVFMNPDWKPLPVHGAYWHQGDERLEEQIIANYFKITPDEVRERTIWDYEIPTAEDAYRVVRRRTM